jgi:protein-tyrosine kinase
LVYSSTKETVAIPQSRIPFNIALSRSVDGVLLVVEAEKSRKQTIATIKKRVLANGGNIVGIIFNKRKYHIPESVYKRFIY